MACYMTPIRLQKGNLASSHICFETASSAYAADRTPKIPHGATAPSQVRPDPRNEGGVAGLRFHAFDKWDAIFLLTHERLSCPPESLSSLQPVCGELIEYRYRR